MKQNTKRLYSMIFALLFIVLALVVYFDMLTPAYTSLQSAKASELSDQALLTNEKQVVNQIQGLLTTYNSQSSDAEAVNTALPVGPDLADGIAQLYGIAGANSLTIQNIGISSQLAAASVPEGDIAGAAATGQIVKPLGTITFALSLVGSYENFQSFLNDLATNMRLFDVQEVSVAPLSGGTGKTSTPDAFTFSISVMTYYQSQ